jgi:hypothetical protein
METLEKREGVPTELKPFAWSYFSDFNMGNDEISMFSREVFYSILPYNPLFGLTKMNWRDSAFWKFQKSNGFIVFSLIAEIIGGVLFHLVSNQES